MGLLHFRFYPQDWLSDPKVRSLTRFERDVFLEMLCHMWRAGPLRDDDRRNSRTLRMSVLVWRQVKTTLILLRLLEIHDGKLLNRRILQNYEHSKRKSATASRNAQARWSKSRDGNSSQRTVQDGRIPLYEKRGEYADAMRAQANSDTYNPEDL